MDPVQRAPSSSPEPSGPGGPQQQTVSLAVGQQTIAPQSGTADIRSANLPAYLQEVVELLITRGLESSEQMPRNASAAAVATADFAHTTLNTYETVAQKASAVSTPEALKELKTGLEGLPKELRVSSLKTFGSRIAAIPFSVFSAVAGSAQGARDLGEVLGMAYPYLSPRDQFQLITKVDFLDDEGWKAQIYVGMASKARPELDGTSKAEFDSGLSRVATRMQAAENKTLVLDALQR